MSQWVIELIRTELKKSTKNKLVICPKCGHHQRLRTRFASGAMITCAGCDLKSRLADFIQPV